MDKLVGNLEQEQGLTSNAFSDFFITQAIPMQNQDSLGSATNQRIQRHFDSINRQSVESLLDDPNIGMGPGFGKKHSICNTTNQFYNKNANSI